MRQMTYYGIYVDGVLVEEDGEPFIFKSYIDAFEFLNACDPLQEEDAVLVPLFDEEAEDILREYGKTDE